MGIRINRTPDDFGNDRFVVVNYSALPDLIPQHYDASGQTNAWSSKLLLCVLPAVATFIYLLLTIGIKFPHRFNYPFEITGHNADLQYKNMTTMIRAVKTLVVVILFYLTYATIQIGLGKMQSIGTWTAPVFVLSIVLIVGFFVRRAFKLR